MANTPPDTAHQTLERLSHDYWEQLMRSQPLWATTLGDHRYDDQLPDLGPTARTAYFHTIRELRTQLQALPSSAFSGQQAITYEVLNYQLDLELEAEPFREDEFTVNPLHHPVIFLTELTEQQPLTPRSALEKLLSRYQKFPAMLAQVEENLNAGLARGMTAPRIGAARVAGQVKRMLEVPAEDSAHMPSETRPEGMSESAHAAMRQALVDAIRDHIYPALATHQRFLEDTYIPACRPEPGLCHMKGGEDYYQYLIRLHTGQTEDAETIHRIGQEELAHIHQEMREIAERTYGDPDIHRMAAKLHDRKDQYLHERDDLVAHNRELLERAMAKVPEYFSSLPETPCEVRPVEAFREADTPAGYYCHAPSDGSRPAYYYVNTYQPEHRPLYNMEALAFHEAVPGHHLQIAIAQGLEDLPTFRKNTGQTAYIEGWALYTERLSDEMGLYSNDFTRFGMLNFQAWRAARLVVDTGLHAFGWSQEKAIQELCRLTVHGRPEATIEVDRYTCMPGQALAYMLGQIHMGQLRQKAMNHLGDRFDIREFHARVLENGAIPMATLDMLIQRWLTSTAV